jgi:putrescine aminotransferase
VALKNLEIIEREGLIARVAEDTGPYLGEALRQKLGDHALVGEIRSFGLLAAIEIVKDKETKTRFDPVGRAASLVRDHAIANGLMMRAVNDTMILSPPLIWTRETIDMACERIAKALDLAARDLRGT